MEIGLLSFYFHSSIIACRHEGNGVWVMLGEHKGPFPCANHPFRLCPHSVPPSSQHSHKTINIFDQSPLVIYFKEPFELNFQIISPLFHKPTVWMMKKPIFCPGKYLYFLSSHNPASLSPPTPIWTVWGSWEAVLTEMERTNGWLLSF